MDRGLGRILRPMQTAIARRAARVVARLVNDAAKMQLLQIGIYADETSDKVERFQNYGFTSVPLAGAEGIIVWLGSGSDHPVCVAMDDRRYRKRNMAPGESAMHNHVGDYIHIKADGTIEVVASTKVKVTAPDVDLIATTVTISGNLVVNGTTGITVPNGDVKGGAISLETHKHINGGGTGNSGTPTP